MKQSTVVMGVISNFLKEHNYTEWENGAGNLIGASYDWRLAPEQLEHKNNAKYFTNLMEQTEAMVAADPEHRPAVVVGFSLGCKIAVLNCADAALC